MLRSAEPTLRALSRPALPFGLAATALACSLSRPSLDEYSPDYGRGQAGSVSPGGTAGQASGGTDNPGDAGAAAAGGTPSTADCVTSGTELCEDFESGKLNVQLWQAPVPASGTTLAVDRTRARSGSYALHIVATPGEMNTGAINQTATFPAKDNRFYTRMFIYLAPDLPTAQPMEMLKAMFYVAYGENAAGNVDCGVGIGLNGRQFLTYSIFRGDPFWQFGPGAEVEAKANEWFCLEILEDGSDPETEVRRVWLNDQDFVQLASDSAEVAGAANPNHTAPEFQSVSLGLMQLFPMPTLTDMWIDDIRVSSQRIGCGSAQ